MKVDHIEMFNHPGGKTKLIIVVDEYAHNVAEVIRPMAGKEVELKLAVKRRRRSLTANAYYWVLVEQIASVIGSSKDEVHEQFLHDYGCFAKDDDGIVVFSVKESKDPKTVTPYSYQIGSGIIDGKKFTHYAVLKGSHEMTAEEFAKLLDGAVSEAKELDIPTLDVRTLKYEDNNTIKAGYEKE